MARIRTIKPEFFRHEDLQDLEIRNPGKCVMLVFAGLWGHCDKYGRFEWRPRQLKLDILPFLPYEMAETLSILKDAGMVRHYTVEGKEYGEITSFEKHQRITGKEAQEDEKYPSPDGETMVKQSGNNRETPEKLLGEQEGKGREEEKEGKGMDISLADEHFESAWAMYPKRPGASKADSKKAWATRIRAGVSIESLLNGVRRYADYCRQTGINPTYIKQPATFFGPGEHYLSDWTAPPLGNPSQNSVSNARAETVAILTGKAPPSLQTAPIVPLVTGNTFEGESRYVG